MSENVIIIITTTLGPIILALIGLRAIKLQQKGIHIVEENTKLTKEASDKIDENTKMTKITHDEVNSKMTQLIEVKDELLKVTGEAKKAEGKIEGKQEEKDKHQSYISHTPPGQIPKIPEVEPEVMKVEVIKSTPIEIVVPKDEGKSKPEKK